MFKQVNYDKQLGYNGTTMGRVYGYNEIQYCYATYQFKNYSRYDVNIFSGEERKKRHEEQFPKDKAAAYDLGKRLTEMAKKQANVHELL